jgi:O-antigen ligase
MLSFWESTNQIGLQEAHNGYLETYLDLGIVGLGILCSFLIACYRTMCKRLTASLDFASLSLALWAIVLIYNLTEAAFRNNPVWATFLLVGITVPASSAAVRLNKQESAENASHAQSRIGGRRGERRTD